MLYNFCILKQFLLLFTILLFVIHVYPRQIVLISLTYKIKPDCFEDFDNIFALYDMFHHTVALLMLFSTNEN